MRCCRSCVVSIDHGEQALGVLVIAKQAPPDDVSSSSRPGSPNWAVYKAILNALIGAVYKDLYKNSDVCYMLFKLGILERIYTVFKIRCPTCWVKKSRLPPLIFA